jgi:hypothetical protein
LFGHDLFRKPVSTLPDNVVNELGDNPFGGESEEGEPEPAGSPSLQFPKFAVSLAVRR